MALEMWAIKYGVSENSFDSPLFHNFVRLVHALPPSADPVKGLQSRKTRTAVIVDALYNVVQRETGESLLNLKGAFSATSDAWTSFHSTNK